MIAAWMAGARWRPGWRRPACVVAAALLSAAPAASAVAAAARAGARSAHQGHATGGCRNADTPPSSASRQAMRTAVVCLINQQRAAHRLAPLHDSALLDRSAQRWTDTMVATGDFSHGTDFAARLTAAGFSWSYAGENIATGFRTPRQVVGAWMASTGHCRNILGPAYADVGTGLSGKAVGRFASGPATWTQDFGLWAGHAPPSGNHRPARGCPYR